MRVKKAILPILLFILLAAGGCSQKDEKSNDGGTNLVNSLDAPVISGLQYVSGLEQTEIAWTTDKVATTQVLIGAVSQTYNFTTTEDTSLVKEHKVILSSLVPNTTFYFKVMSKDADHNVSISNESSFLTPALYLPDTDKVLDAEDNNNTFDRHVGDLIELQLEVSGSTGYGWWFSGLDTGYFEETGAGTRVLTPMLGGAGASVLGYWQVKLKKAGTAEIKMKYYRSWEGESSSIDEYKIIMNIY